MRRLRFQSLEPRHLLAAMPVGDDLLVNDQVAGVQQLNPESEAVAALPEGGFVVAFEGRGHQDLQGIYVRRFDVDGQPIGEADAQLVNTTFNGQQVAPTVASYNDGSFVVVWAGRGVGDRYGIFAQFFDADGEKIGTEARINQVVGGQQLAPSVTTDTNGRTIVVWEGVGSGDAAGVFARVLSNVEDDFMPLTDEFRINVNTDGEQAQADVASDAEGNFIVTWSSRHQEESAWSLRVRRFDLTSMMGADELAVSDDEGANQTESSIVQLATGEFVVAWSNRSAGAVDWDLLARRLDTEGVPMDDDPFQLNETTAGQQHDVDLMATATGGYLAVWTSNLGDGSGDEVMARDFDATDAALADEMLLNSASSGFASGDQGRPSVAGLGADIAVVWSGRGMEDLQGVYAQRLMIDVSGGPNIAPVIEPIGTQQARRAVEFTLTVTASDLNGDELTFELDDSISPEAATITKTSDTTAEIRWTPTTSDLPSRNFRVRVIDNGEGELEDTQDFIVNVSQSAGSI